MTPQEKARLFGQVFSLLGSDQAGERLAALEKMHALRTKMGWPTFADVLLKLESTITPEQLVAAEKDAAQWKQAHDARVKENAAVARRNAVLAARAGALQSALWLSINWRVVAGAAVVAALSYGGWHWSNAEAAPDNQPVSDTTDSAQAAVDIGLRDVLSRTRWGSGDTPPVIVRVNGVDFWLVVRGTTDATSHADDKGRPIERHCVTLHAREAVRDAGAFLKPEPYLAFGWWMKWPLRAAECRLPGKANY